MRSSCRLHASQKGRLSGVGSGRAFARRVVKPGLLCLPGIRPDRGVCVAHRRRACAPGAFTVLTKPRGLRQAVAPWRSSAGVRYHEPRRRGHMAPKTKLSVEEIQEILDQFNLDPETMAREMEQFEKDCRYLSSKYHELADQHDG